MMTVRQMASGRPLRMLVVSYYFPPMATPRAIRLALLASELRSRHGVEITVLCADTTRWQGQRDVDLLKLVDPGIQVTRTWTFESLLLKKLTERYFPFTMLATPDHALPWMHGAVQRGQRLLRERDYDVLYSLSAPPTSHLVGKRLARTRRVHWVAFFSDPWTREMICKRDWAKERINAGLEKQIILSAGSLAFPSSHCAEWILGRYAEEQHGKALCVPHAYQETLYTKAGIPEALFQADARKFRLLHTGTLYARRTAHALFGALKHMATSQKECYADLEVVLLGGDQRRLHLQLAELGLCEKVRAGGSCSYLESLAAMRGADVLLVIDAPLEHSPFFPSKLADYVGAKRPILGITPGSGASADILRMLGQPVVRSFAPEAIAAAIVDLWRHWKQKTLADLGADDHGRYDVRTVAADFLAQLQADLTSREVPPQAKFTSDFVCQHGG